MRQVNKDELVHVLGYAIARLPKSMIARLKDGRPEVEGQARHMMAGFIADFLDRWEILSSAPPPPPFRRRGTGTGAPKIDEGEI
jgi:hypothetical protein